jgi:hypothetical protein
MGAIFMKLGRAPTTSIIFKKESFGLEWSRYTRLEMNAAHWKLDLRPGIQKHFVFFGLSGLFGLFGRLGLLAQKCFISIKLLFHHP